MLRLALSCCFSLALCISLLRAAEVRLALMDFTTDENSYPAMRAAVDISALLPPLVILPPETSWVERNELCHAQKELELSLAQFSRANALRCGKWARADRLVLGNFARNERGDWTLDLEIMDVARAETLAETKVYFPGTASRLLSSLVTNAPMMAEQVAGLQAKAKSTAAQLTRKRAVAPLFFFNSSRWRLPTEDELQEPLFEAIEHTATNLNLRIATFARANRASKETELAALGLTDSDSHAWQNVADIFVWGNYAVTNVPGGAKSLEANLWVWRQGRLSSITDSTRFNGNLTVRAVGDWISQLAAQAMKVAVQSSLEGVPEDRPNEKIAESAVALTEGVGVNRPGLMRNGSRADPMAIQMFELACFFDPGNAQAQAERLRQRYGKWTRFRFETRNQFWTEWKRAEAWGKYVEKFGLHPGDETNRAARYNAIVSEYVGSLKNVLDTWRLYNKEQCCGFPSGAPSEIEAQWNSHVQREYGRRITNAAQYLAGGPMDESHSSAEFPTSTMTFGFVQKGLNDPATPLPAEKRMTLLAAISNRIAESWPKRVGINPRTLSSGPTVAMAVPTKPAIENTNWMRQRVALFESPQLDFRPPLLTPTLETFNFPKGADVRSVSQIENRGGLLWLLCTDERKDNSRRANPELAAEIRSPRSRIWNFNPRTKEFSIYSPLEREKVIAFQFAGDELWFSGERVARMNLRNGQLRRYSFSDGMTLADTLAIARAGERWFALGGFFRITSLTGGESWQEEQVPRTRCGQSSTSRALSADNRWLLFWAGTASFYDTTRNVWTNFDSVLNCDSTVSLPMAGASAANDGHGGFWVGDSFGLRLLWPERMAMRAWPAQKRFFAPAPYNYAGPVSSRQAAEQSIYAFVQRRVRKSAFIEENNRDLRSWIHPCRLFGAPQVVVADSDFIWLAVGDAVLVFHHPSESWVGYFNAPSPISSLQVTPDTVWIGMANWPDRPLLARLDRKSIVATPRARWIRDEIDNADIETSALRLKRREQMLWRLNSADYATALKLATAPGTETDLESCFVQGICYSAAGLHDFERCRATYQRIAEKFPDSPWADAARTLIEFDAWQHNRRVRETALLRQFDRNADGVLDASERATMQGDEKYLAGERAVKEADDSRILDSLFQRYDKNGDGLLDIGELRPFLRAGQSNPLFRELFLASPPRKTPLFSGSELGGDTNIRRLDLNKDWRLDRDELRRALRTQ